MNSKLTVDTLVFEVTRRCNMSCKHCLRGESENLEITREIIDKTLDNIEVVNNITFSGGEPVLNLDAIAYTLEACKERNIPVYGFYIVTNGKFLPDEFLQIMNEWFFYTVECNISTSQNEEVLASTIGREMTFFMEEYFSGVALSADKYHDKIPFKNILKLQSLGYYHPNDKKLADSDTLINMGRAEKLTGVKKVELSEYRKNAICLTSETEADLLYVNAKGDVLGCCDLSYEKQEEYKKVNVNNPTWLEELRKMEEV